MTLRKVVLLFFCVSPAVKKNKKRKLQIPGDKLNL